MAGEGAPRHIPSVLLSLWNPWTIQGETQMVVLGLTPQHLLLGALVICGVFLLAAPFHSLLTGFHWTVAQGIRHVTAGMHSTLGHNITCHKQIFSLSGDVSGFLLEVMTGPVFRKLMHAYELKSPFILSSKSS